MRALFKRMAAAATGVFLLLAYLTLPALLPGPPPVGGDGVVPAAAQGGAGPATAEAPGGTPAGTALPEGAPDATLAAAFPDHYRAVWVSYLEWQTVDFSGEAAFLADVEAMLDNIAALGATVVLAHVRPFGDALYPSQLYPFSHLCTGTQGQDPGYDPLALLAAAAHARGLQVEAWVNPYRLQSGGVPALCVQSPARLHPDWVREAGGGLYLDPANADARQYIADGLAELCENYAIDGIHFDDYFYPTTDPAFDADAYAAYTAGGGTLDLDGWRRQQVDALVSLCWRTVHRYPGLRFGIAPQGDPENNLATQYSDAARWLAEPGYVDYLMPQLYWGLEGRPARLRLAALAGTWAAYPRAEGVRLYAGLGAYRIGDGDGGGSAEWRGGGALAAQARALEEQGIEGAALYRYGSLFNNADWPDLAAQERQALAALWRNA